MHTKHFFLLMMSAALLLGCQKNSSDSPAPQVSPGTAQDSKAPQFSGLTSAVAVSSSAVNLSWTAASDDTTPTDQIVYDIYRSTASGLQNFSTPTYSTTPGATHFTASGLMASTVYYFVVRAKDQVDNQETNSVEQAVATQADTTPPVFSGASGATVLSSSQIQVAWSNATDDATPASGITYLIYKSTSSSGITATAPAAIVTGGTSYVLSGLTANTTYYVVVRAQDQSGNRELNTIVVSAQTAP